MKKSYHSNGKLLLTGEYFVLDGAEALAVPCKLGQSLTVEPSEIPGIAWESYDNKQNLWFQHHFTVEEIQHLPEEHPKTIQGRLHKILHFSFLNRPLFFENIKVVCKTHLQFPRDWGLGSSSTLIQNIAEWTGGDAYQLLESSFGGSGYDLAAAKSKTALIYSRFSTSRAVSVPLDWDFKDQIFFVHRNQKQDSKEGIARYRTKSKDEKAVNDITNLTQKILLATTLQEWSAYIEEHEKIVGKYLSLPTIKSELFKDYPYSLKSLGAWGGDFFMAIGGEEEKVYFREKGYTTILSFEEMVLP